jgi:hypothetical protein
MIATNNLTEPYARSLLAATPPDQLSTSREQRYLGATKGELRTLARESARLDEMFFGLAESYASEALRLIGVTGFIRRLLRNQSIARYISRRHPLELP